jgi:hypothetical protein
LAESTQYLRIGLWGVEYLLPSSASLSIEQRENLILNGGPVDTNITAWRAVNSERWPAFYLNAELELTRGDNWQRAVFLEATPHPIGLIADEVQLLPRTDVHIEPFTPLGLAPTPGGHLFSGAWVRANQVILLFEPNGLISYLQKLSEVENLHPREA